ncbi:MAG: TonB-dependent receptor plug domain-containing protein, partial [Prevotellaceae bacterium]|nr:TonB-dependent receptor plug domain-containing protein [Prevotellaceae bacterium]
MGTKTQEVPVRANVVVRLEPEVKSIDEVMVVAFGTQKKGTFTGSAAIVGANEIEKVQVTNPVDALRGKAAGVQVYSASGAPGTTPTIRIRGVNSINAGNAPLIVLDGSPYDGSLNDINPADVESMTVLKDASSTALYGARGGNGVILITTKTAKKNTPVVVNFDAKWGSNMRGVPEYNKIKSPAQYYETWYGALNTYAKNMWGWDATQRWKWANENLINGKDTGLGYNVYTLDGA